MLQSPVCRVGCPSCAARGRSILSFPPGAEKYAAIDGKRMRRDVVAQALISRRYRDRVHPKFWGRIIGTSSDAESAEWLARRFKEIGL